MTIDELKELLKNNIYTLFFPEFVDIDGAVSTSGWKSESYKMYNNMDHNENINIIEMLYNINVDMCIHIKYHDCIVICDKIIKYYHFQENRDDMDDGLKMRRDILSGNIKNIKMYKIYNNIN